VTYKAPLEIVPDTVEELFKDEGERALAENAIWWFIDNPSFEERDRLKLREMFKRKGWNMFMWKYYRVGRAYLGGYKALSACLKLRSVR